MTSTPWIPQPIYVHLFPIITLTVNPPLSFDPSVSKGNSSFISFISLLEQFEHKDLNSGDNSDKTSFSGFIMGLSAVLFSVEVPKGLTLPESYTHLFRKHKLDLRGKENTRNKGKNCFRLHLFCFF